MKTNYLKRSLWLAAILLTSLCGKAQTKTTPQTAYDSDNHNTDYSISSNAGHRIEKIKTEIGDKIYRIEMADEKMISLYVDGEKIPEADWSKYSDVISRIREEIKEQIKRNEEQAKRNAEQAIRNQEQAKKNEEQGKRNAEQNIRDQEQAKRNEEQAVRNQEQEKKNAEQAIRDQEQSKRDQEQVGVNEIQAKKNAEQAIRNQEQEKRNAEQSIRNQEQAKRNEEQAKANAKMIKDITADLVSDKIIPDSTSLREMKINEFGMSINGVKQPDEVFKKYKAKFPRFSEGSTFTY